MIGKAFVFLNPVQAARFGHVGWGFTLEEGDEPTCYFGSTDHLWRSEFWDIPAWLRYAHVIPSNDIDWWEDSGVCRKMMDVMANGHHLRYHLVKELPVANAQPQLACQKARSLARSGWSLLANNCVHHTYSVLEAYGAALPPPMESPLNLIPRRWFANIEGTMAQLQR
jgi:hypothetical protein